MQNTGMLAGGAIGMMSGGGGNMMEGMVVGQMVGQRIGQAKHNAYWQGQAMEYRQQLATGQIQPVSASMATEAPWWSREARGQRRMKRWERRAARRDGTPIGD